MASESGRDYIGVGVGGMILSPAGESPERVLLSQRGPLARNQRGQWENPGGALDFGEEFHTAIVREIAEELGIVVELEGLLRVVNHIIPTDGQHWVSPTFVCRYVSGEPRVLEPGKCSGVGWFALDGLPEPLTVISGADINCYRRLRASGRGLLPIEWSVAGGAETER